MRLAAPDNPSHELLRDTHNPANHRGGHFSIVARDNAQEDGIGINPAAPRRLGAGDLADKAIPADKLNVSGAARRGLPEPRILIHEPLQRTLRIGKVRPIESRNRRTLTPSGQIVAGDSAPVGENRKVSPLASAGDRRNRCAEHRGGQKSCCKWNSQDNTGLRYYSPSLRRPKTFLATRRAGVTITEHLQLTGPMETLAL